MPEPDNYDDMTPLEKLLQRNGVIQPDGNPVRLECYFKGLREEDLDLESFHEMLFPDPTTFQVCVG